MIPTLVLAAVTLGVIGGSDAAERASAASSDLQIAVGFEHAPLGVYDQAQARQDWPDHHPPHRRLKTGYFRSAGTGTRRIPHSFEDGTFPFNSKPTATVSVSDAPSPLAPG